MKILLISIHSLALNYLKESFDEKHLKNTTLITDKLTNELKIYLKSKNIKFLTTKTLNNSLLKKLNLKNCLVISAGSPWVFGEKQIKKFGEEFYNVHQSPLPSMRGSVASYIILYDIRAFQTCLHRVTRGIDTGNVAYRKSFIIPSSLKIPKDINNFLQEKNREMVKHFINSYNKKN